ncbi:MAG: ABC transporter substrate-binding protein [Actinobacteria bacterium]|nr:ABC transporter substrate-binding protein [Actinomycetota bacterium]
MKRLSKLLILVMTLALIASACVSGTSETTTTPTTQAATTTTSGQATVTTTTAPAATTTAAAPVETIKIGAIHPLTGALAGAGTKMDNAAKMAVADINEAGGIASLGGAKLELLSADSTGAPEVGQAEAERLVGEGVVGLIGSYQSSVTTNVAAIAERSNVPLVIDVAVADSILQQGYKYSFRVQPNATAMGKYGAEFLNTVATAAGEPVTKVSYLHEESGFGTSVFEAFKAAAADYGIEVVAEIPYGAFTVTDLTTEMTQAAAPKPDVIVVTGYYNDGLLAARAAKDLAVDVKAIFGVANGAFDTPEFTADFAAGAEGFFDSNYHYNAASTKVADVRDRYQAQYGELMDTASVLAYQAVVVLADAIERAGSTDPTAIRDALSQTNLSDHLMAYPGPIKFNSAGENVNAQPVLMQVQNGAVQQVWPAELQESQPKYPAVSWK